MQTINFDIGQLLKKIRSGDFLIPQFQRDFTWKEGQTRLLIDSIARDYPVGSLLILGKNKEIQLKSRQLDTTPSTVNKKNDNAIIVDELSSESYYVLDGQQRLTSIARVFLDSHPKKHYYFDLKKMLKVFDTEDPSWIISRVRGKKNPERKDNNRLIRTDIVLDQSKCDVFIPEYIEDSGDFPDFESNKNEARQASARLKGVFEIIRKFSIPFVVLDNDAPLESVCRVFETINSTGTRLKTFDLAVARYYPKPDLKDFYDNSKEEHQIFNEYEIDGEQILQILSLYYLRNKVNKFPEATRKILLSLPCDFLTDEWVNAAKNLSETCIWLEELGVTSKTKPSNGILVSIAATLMCFPNSLSNHKFSNALKKWYFCSTLAAEPALANNYKIGNDFRGFCDFLDNDKLIPYPRVFFKVEDIIGIKRITNIRYKAIQSLMKYTSNKDMMTGNSLLNSDLEDHHIYPYSLYKSGIKKDELNSIANKIIVSTKTNRKIGNTNPDKYLLELATDAKKNGNTEDLDQRLKNCFIPYSSQCNNFGNYFQKNSFEQFLEDRAESIINGIKKIVGNAWKES